MNNIPPGNVHPFPRDPGPGNGSDVRERLARIEAHMQHMATRAWVLGGVVGGMGLAAALTIAIIKLFGA